jgi:hypothetical protein
MLAGEFSDYKDPGHLIGRGWMELTFQRLVICRQSIIPVSARVVNAKGYQIDNQGRILGKGHAVRETISWLIPILWPIDLINLPRRSPRPTLKAETQLTVKLMDDVELPQQVAIAYQQAPVYQQPAPDSYVFVQRPVEYQYSPVPPVQFISPVDSYGNPLFTPEQLLIMQETGNYAPGVVQAHPHGGWRPVGQQVSLRPVYHHAARE